MQDVTFMIEEYQEVVLFGILINFIFTIGFGVYKSMNLDQKQMMYLMDKYPIKNNTLRIASLWFVPYLGYIHVLKDVWLVQTYLKNNQSVFDYVEDKLKKELNHE